MRQMQEFVGRLATIAGVDYEYALDSFGISNVPGASTITRPAENIDFPVGLPVEGFISRRFSDEHGNYHPGIDLACPQGTPVLATASGVVESAVFDQEYGYVVTIRHSDSVKTLYGHNREILVDPGQQIDVGSRIALSGSTGRSTAPHVHYEIRIHDKPINPVEGPEHD
jgi:murein DD-endopeptidase MepM/ murein hydrolase activator NlpD